MSMADQYEDGRYDGAPKRDWITEGHTVIIDESFDLPFAGLGPRPASSYGKRTPKDQRVRSTKETHMPERMTKAQINHELHTNTQLMEALRYRRRQLNDMAKKALPAEPPSSCTMFTVSVRFKMRGQRYQFLILRSGGHYWTTGTKEGQMVFSSWDALCGWLEGPDVYDHSDIEVLKGSGQQVSFDTGTLVSEDTIGLPPF